MIKINLLAEAKPTKKKKGVAALGGAGRLNVLLLGAAIGIGLLAAFIHWYILNDETKKLEEKIRVAQAEVTRLESILKEVRDFEDKKAKLQKKVDLINQLKTNQRGPVRLMDEVSKALPDLLWLEKMTYAGTTINLDGKALNPNAVANFLENLKRVPSFQEPKVQSIDRATGVGAELYNFKLSFVFSNIDKTQGDPAAAAPAPKTAEMPFRPGAAVPAAAAVAGF